MIVFLFPLVKEIAGKDSRAEFNAQIGPFQFPQSFHVDEMIYRGKTVARSLRVAVPLPACSDHQGAGKP